MIGDGISVWVPVISAGAGILGALGSQWLSHIFITKREKRSSDEKLNRERYFIATEIVFLLERFAQACVEPAEEISEFDDEGYITTLHEFPPFDYCSGQQKLTIALEFFQNNRSDSFGVKPPLY